MNLKLTTNLISHVRIDSYKFGQIVVNGKTYNQDLIIFPNRVRDGWWRREGHELCLDDIREVIEEKPEVLVVGTGDSGLVKILDEVKERLKKEKIDLIAKPTKKACALYNNLSPQRKVVAALHLTC